MKREDDGRRDEAKRQNDRQTGPWAVALGVLAIGVGAVLREVRRNRGERSPEKTGGDGASEEDDA
ncbi:hypothetical protein [Haladaptatus sp. NG-WS-4]